LLFFLSGSSKYDNRKKLSKNVLTANELEVIGLGFGRTGTYSLKLALDRLGYPTLHTHHIYEIPELLDKWCDKVFETHRNEEKLNFGKKDDIFEIFDTITSYGFKGSVDLPTAYYVKELFEKYPNAKFILTTRESSDIWLQSFESMQSSFEKITNRAGFIYKHVHQLAIYCR